MMYKNGNTVLIFISLAAQHFKTLTLTRALHSLCCLIPAAAAAAVAAAAAAGWLSVWRGARGTAWQTPWPQRYLLNRP